MRQLLLRCVPFSLCLYPQVGLAASSLLNFGSFWYQELPNVAGCHGNVAGRSHRRAHRGDGVDDCRQRGEADVEGSIRRLVETLSVIPSPRLHFLVTCLLFLVGNARDSCDIVEASFKESMFRLNPDVATVEKMSVNHQSRHLAGSDSSAQ